VTKQDKRLVAFAITVVTLLIFSNFLPASAQLSQWRSLNPYRDGTLPITGTPLTAPPFLYSVHFLSPNYGWAVGGDCDIYTFPIVPLGVAFAPACQVLPGKGFALFYDGAKWNNVLVPATTGTLTGVFAVSTTDVWAVGLGDSTGKNPTVIHWDGIAWTLVPAPAGTGHLLGIYMFPAGTDGWAVGDCATHPCAANEVDNIRWSGTFPNGAWSPGPTPALFTLGGARTLRAVSLNSPTFGWIVASDGSIFKWDGLGWTLQTSPVTNDLLSVNAVSNTDAWAVGKGSTIIRWNGASWGGPMVAPTVGLDYHSIRMVSATDGWIAGVVNTATNEGVLLRWNGVAWSIVRSWVTSNLNGLFMLPDGMTGSAVGDAETIVYWNNAQWISQTSPTALPLFDVYMVSSRDGWAVGGPFPLGIGGTMGSSIFHWDGTHWFHYETLPSPNTLIGVFMLNTNDGWAVGNAASSSAPPAILHWDGTSWTVKSPPGVALGGTLTDVHALSPTEAWAVGFSDSLGAAGPPPILKWDGTIWASVPAAGLTSGVLAGLHMLSSTDGWVVGCKTIACAPGDALILRWNGLAWSSVTPPESTTIAGLLDIFMLTPTNGWAVGLVAGDGQGTILHWDGTQWRRAPAPPGAFLTSVYMVSATDGWAVGYDSSTNLSLILHWNGLTWDVVPTPAVPSTMKNILTSVFMVSAFDGWITSGYTFVPSGLSFGPGSGLFLHYGPEVVPGTTTSMTTSTSFTTVVSTITGSTTSTGSTSTMTPASGGTWGVPGFPIESILAGLLGGLIALTVIRRRRRP
jgi:hypothetical protein